MSEEIVSESDKSIDQKKIYRIGLRKINGGTNPRNPLSPELQNLGYNSFVQEEGQKSLFLMGISENPEERAEFVRLIKEHDDCILRLATTILTEGLMQPIEVREGGTGTFTIVFGARRALATLYNWATLGKPKEPVIQAVLVKGSQHQLLHRAFIENDARRNSNPMEDAKSFLMAINNGETEDEVALARGVTVQTVKNKLALLQLPLPIQRKVANGMLKQTKAIASVKTADQNGQPPKVRKRKEIEEAMREFGNEHPARLALEWALGMRDKIV